MVAFQVRSKETEAGGTMGIPRACQLRIFSVFDDLKTAERRAVEYLLDSPDDVPLHTIGDFARRAGCSEATVVRLSKRLGYEGFPELKRAFAETSGNDPLGDFENVTASDDPVTAIEKVFESAVTGLQDTLSVIDRDAYIIAVEALSKAARIVFCGLGDGASVAFAASQRFERVGQTCWAPTDADQQLVLAANLEPSDVLVAISHSGRSTTILDAMLAARRSGAVLIAITNFPGSPIARESDVVLQTAVFTIDWSGEVASKRIAQLCIVESLFANFMIQRGGAATDTLRRINNVVRIHKKHG